MCHTNTQRHGYGDLEGVHTMVRTCNNSSSSSSCSGPVCVSIYNVHAFIKKSVRDDLQKNKKAADPFLTKSCPVSVMESKSKILTTPAPCGIFHHNVL